MNKKFIKKTVSDTICRVHKSDGYAVLSNCFVRSTKISCQAIGLLGREKFRSRDTCEKIDKLPSD